MQLKFTILAIMMVGRVLTAAVALPRHDEIISEDIGAAIHEKRDCSISFCGGDGKLQCGYGCKADSDGYTICQGYSRKFFRFHELIVSDGSAVQQLPLNLEG